MRLVLLSIAALVAIPAIAEARPHVHHPERSCAIAGRTVVEAPVGFDSVRVVVADAAPGAAVDVTVLAGAADRRVHAWGAGAWSLTMDPTAPGPVVVAVEPSLDARRGACVERVELLRETRVIADVRVR